MCRIVHNIGGVPVLPKDPEQNVMALRRTAFLEALRDVLQVDGQIVSKILLVLEIWMFGHPSSQALHAVPSNNSGATHNRRSSHQDDEGRVSRWKKPNTTVWAGMSIRVDAVTSAAGPPPTPPANNTIAEQFAEQLDERVLNADEPSGGSSNSTTTGGAETATATGAGGEYPLLSTWVNERCGEARCRDSILKEMVRLQLSGMKMKTYLFMGYGFPAFLRNFRKYEEDLYVWVDKMQAQGQGTASHPRGSNGQSFQAISGAVEYGI